VTALFASPGERVDPGPITDRLRAVWDHGEHDRLLRAIEPVAEAVADLAEIRPGARVLDVGAGDGNVAVACAGRGARVSACDLAPGMVVRGRVRAGRRVEWTVADVRELPYPDRSFDVVVSSFGATLAPDPAAAVSELARVARPGATVVLAAWVPRGLPGRLDELADRVDPLPEGIPMSSRWGVQAVAERRLSPALRGLELRARSVPLRFADADEAFAALVGTTMLDPDRRPELRQPFDELLASCNESRAAVEIRARYLLIRGRMPSPPRRLPRP
jgi:SAM-dependent methyltransferase